MSLWPETPRTLVDALATEAELDECRWGQFDAMYRPVVACFIRQRFEGLVHLTDDIAQEAMIRIVNVLRGGGYDRKRGKMRTFLQTIVYNVCIDHLRRLRPDDVSFDEIDVERLTASDGPDGFGRMMDLQWCESCRLAARHYVLHETPVSPVHREIYRELEKGGKPAEIASRHGMTADAVRQIHHRLDKLIEAYARELAE